MQSHLPYLINSLISRNQEEKSKYFYTNFIKKREILTPEIEFEYLYRAVILDPSEKNFYIRSQYLNNHEYYWPSFVSTYLDEASVLSLLKKNIINTKQEILFFVIKICKSRRSNKINLFNKVAQAQEILLLPYFNFKVLHSEPKKVEICKKNKNICKIYIEEIEKIIFDISIVWYDPQINNLENRQYQVIIKEKNDNLKVFDDENKAKDFIFGNDKFQLVISCGSQAHSFLEKIKGNNFVLAIILFVGEGKKQKYDHLMQKYTICKEVCDSLGNVLAWIPKQKILY